MTRSNTKSIVFDLDGTLVDSSSSIYKAYNLSIKNFQSLSLFSYKSFCSYIGPPFTTMVLNMYPHITPNILYQVTSNFRHYYDNIYFKNYEIYDGVHDTLTYLRKRNYKIYIVSNKPHKLVTYISNESFHELVDSAIGRDSSSYSKELAASNLNKRNPISCVVGDTIDDYNVSKHIGSSFVYARYGFGNLSHTPGIKYIDTFSDIKQIII